MPYDVNQRLCGHKAMDVGDSYGHGNSRVKLAKWMRQIKVPVDLSHLYPKAGSAKMRPRQAVAYADRRRKPTNACRPLPPVLSIDLATIFS